MKLIVGLGNPGRIYEYTRHNIGYLLLDVIAKCNNVSFTKEKFNAKYVDFISNNDKFILVKPLSFMNLSGSVVKKFVDFYKVSFDDILIIQDDLDMDFGRVKFVYDSSSGGHNGIKDIEKCLGTKKYFRLKIGISNNKNINTKDYVLGNFSTQEKEILNDIFSNLKYICDDLGVLTKGQIMSKYNKK